MGRSRAKEGKPAVGVQGDKSWAGRYNDPMRSATENYDLPSQSEQASRLALLGALEVGDLAQVEMLTRALGASEIGALGPLCAVCFMGWADCAAQMLRLWPQMASQSGGQECGPMSWAVRMGGQDCVQALIDAGLGDETAADGMTSLMWASGEGRAEAVESLIVAGADPLSVGGRGENPMSMAAMGGRGRVLELLWSAAFSEAHSSRWELALSQADQAALEALEMGEAGAARWLASMAEARRLSEVARPARSGGSPWL